MPTNIPLAVLYVGVRAKRICDAVGRRVVDEIESFAQFVCDANEPPRRERPISDCNDREREFAECPASRT